MRTKERIIAALTEIAEQLQCIKSEWCIIGSSAMVLSGMNVADVSDIDILTSDVGAAEFKRAFRQYMEISPKTEDDELFHSDFTRFNLPMMNIEIMGNLHVQKDGKWHLVRISEFQDVVIGDIVVKIPSVNELKRLLLLFGRDKDLKRLRLFR